MRTITVRQVQLKIPWDHVAHHKIQIPDVSEPGFYRTITSFNAFFNSIYRRNWSDDHLFQVIDDRMTERRQDWELQRDDKLPVHEHASLYAFFDAIGYDRTTKKYKH